MTGVIDIGSNTIRAVVYDDEMQEIFNQSVVSKLFDYTADAILTTAGIIWLSNVVGTLKVMTEQQGVTPVAFATSAFRDLNNAGEVAEYIKEYTGVGIQILSGEDEAECDFVSLKAQVDISTGIGVDLGGGSCQIFSFDDGKLTDSLSLKLGVKRLKNEFVSGTIADTQELENVYRHVKKSLPKLKQTDCIYIFGGSARAMLGLKEHTFGDGNDITIEQLADMTEFSEQTLREITGKRFDTVGIAVAVIKAIADCADAKAIKVVNCSVREGFIIKYVK